MSDFGDDVNKEYEKSMDELMIELKLKTEKLLKKFKEQNKKDRVKA